MAAFDAKTFERTWNDAKDDLGGFFYRKGCNTEDIEDLVQETALRAWRGSHQLRGAFNPWVFAIARRVFFDYLKKKKQDGELPEDYEIEDTSPGPSHIAAAKVLMEQCLGELDPVARKCLVLHALEGINIRKIAELLDIPPSTAHYHIDRARALLLEKYPGLMPGRRSG
jgi:RNA polymerase sigma-70 factor (ECF subfamily)